MSGNFPLVSHAQVVALDPVRGFVTVQLPSLQIPGLRARLLYHGPADALRIHQKAMPTVGTWGLVLCPYGDSRQAIWAGALLTTLLDARTGDSDPYVEYNSHWSGAFEHMDGKGNYHRYFPDGSYEAYATSTALPSITRHTVDNTQTQQTTAYPAGQRTAAAVSARPYTNHHASGTNRSITASGSLTDTIANGQTYQVAANGSTINIDATGNATVNIAAGKTISINANGSTIGIDASGNIEFSLGSGDKMLVNNGGGTGDFLVLASKLVAAFNAHVHVNSGGSGLGGIPQTPLTSAGISSGLFGVTD